MRTRPRKIKPPGPIEALPEDPRKVMEVTIRLFAESGPLAWPGSMPIEERIAGIKELVERGYIQFVLDEATDQISYELTLPKKYTTS